MSCGQRDAGMQSSLTCSIMYTSDTKKHPFVRCGPYLSHTLLLALVPGKTGHDHKMLTKLSNAAVTFHKIAYVSQRVDTARAVLGAPPEESVLCCTVMLQ